jgi:hypothetical protein
MKRIALFLLFACIVGFSSLAAAQDKPKTETKPADAKPADAKPADAKPAAGLPSSDEILDKFVAAIGGKDAVLKQNSHVMKGSFDIEAMGVSGTVEVYTKAPNKNAVVVTIPSFGVFNQVYDGDKGWSLNPMEGLRELSGGELAAAKRRSDFYTALNYKKNYSKLTVTGKEKVGASEAYVIEATPAEGAPEKLYFDVATNLLVRHDFEAESPQGKIPTESYIEDYKAVDGVKLPHTMKQVSPVFSMSMKFTEVKTNVPIEDAKFGKPSAQ